MQDQVVNSDSRQPHTLLKGGDPVLKDALVKLPLGFGGGAISGEGGGYGFGPISEEEARTLLLHAFERGFRLFDTAPIYGFGLSEERMGRSLKPIRDRVFLVSKCGVSWHEPSRRVNMTNDPLVAKSMLEDSLRRLQTDMIDLYMVHWPDERVDIRKSMEVLVRAQEKGQIRHIGLCNTFPSDFARASEIAKISVVQSELNIFNPKPYRTIEATLQSENVSFMSWGTLDKGIISGTVKKRHQFAETDSRARAPWWKWSDVEKKLKVMEQIHSMLTPANKEKTPGLNGTQLALAHNLKLSNVDVLLVGPKSLAQLDDLIFQLEQARSETLNAQYEKLASDITKLSYAWNEGPEGQA